MAGFVDYEAEVRECLEKCQGSSPSAAAAMLKEARDLLDQMKLEMRTMPAADKEIGAATIKALEADLHAAELAALTGEGGGGSGGFKGGSGNAADAAKARATAAVSKLERSSVRLDRTRALVAEMEETGTDISGMLAENREKISSAHGKVKQTKGELDKAEKITTRMGKWWANW